jgi:hypothetical protein
MQYWQFLAKLILKNLFLFGNCLREKIGSILEKFKEMGKI